MKYVNYSFSGFFVLSPIIDLNNFLKYMNPNFSDFFCSLVEDNEELGSSLNLSRSFTNLSYFFLSYDEIKESLENSWRLYEIQSSGKLSKKNQKMGYSSSSSATSPPWLGFHVAVPPRLCHPRPPMTGSPLSPLREERVRKMLELEVEVNWSPPVICLSSQQKPQTNLNLPIWNSSSCLLFAMLSLVFSRARCVCRITYLSFMNS